MNIVVCVKQVHIYPFGVDATAPNASCEGVVRMVNPYDEAAVEEAIRIREAAGRGTVTVVTVGPPQAAESLRWCLAMGADLAVHVVDETDEGRDPWTVSHLLAQSIESLECDLVLCGRTSVDHGMGQVGAFVAELLGLPLVTSVIDLRLDFRGESAELQRLLERGHREIVQCPLPAVFTVEKGLNRPRYPTLAGRQAASAAHIRSLPATDLPRQESARRPVLEISRIAPPKIRPKKLLTPDASLSAAGRLKFVLSGGMADKKGGAIGGNPEQLARGIYEFLKQKNFIGS